MYKIKKINLPNSLLVIERGVFTHTALSELAIPYSVTNFERCDFSKTNVKKVLYGTNTKIDKMNFDQDNPPTVYKAHSQEEWDELYEQHFK